MRLRGVSTFAVASLAVFAGVGLAAVPRGGPSKPLRHVTATSRCRVAGPRPDRRCTPGAVFTRANRRVVCARGYAGRVRHVTAALKRRVFAAYGIRRHRRGEYEVDHLVSLELGGSNDQANLFPEAAKPRPGFHEKDRLENRLHALVCAGDAGLGVEQRRIATDWVAEYRRLVLG